MKKVISFENEINNNKNKISQISPPSLVRSNSNPNSEIFNQKCTNDFIMKKNNNIKPIMSINRMISDPLLLCQVNAENSTNPVNIFGKFDHHDITSDEQTQKIKKDDLVNYLSKVPPSQKNIIPNNYKSTLSQSLTHIDVISQITKNTSSTGSNNSRGGSSNSSSNSSYFGKTSTSKIKNNSNKKINEEFHQLFKELSTTDTLINKFFCSIYINSNYEAGYLYVADHNLCYNSTIKGKEHLIIPYKDILSITENSFDSLQICTPNIQYTFSNFFSKKKAYEIIHQLWLSNNNPTNKKLLISVVQNEDIMEYPTNTNINPIIPILSKEPTTQEKPNQASLASQQRLLKDKFLVRSDFENNSKPNPETIKKEIKSHVQKLQKPKEEEIITSKNILKTNIHNLEANLKKRKNINYTKGNKDEIAINNNNEINRFYFKNILNKQSINNKSSKNNIDLINQENNQKNIIKNNSEYKSKVIKVIPKQDNSTTMPSVKKNNNVNGNSSISGSIKNFFVNPSNAFMDLFNTNESHDKLASSVPSNNSNEKIAIKDMGNNKSNAINEEKNLNEIHIVKNGNEEPVMEINRDNDDDSEVEKYVPPKEYKTIFTSEYNQPIQRLWHVLFDDGKSPINERESFLEEFTLKDKTDFKCSEWFSPDKTKHNDTYHPTELSSNWTREMSYIMAVNAPIGPKKTNTSIIEECIEFKKNKIIIKNTSSTPDVPFGSSFNSILITCLYKAKNQSCIIEVFGNIHWLKSCMMKKTIEKMGINGMIDHHKNLNEALIKYFKNNPESIGINYMMNANTSSVECNHNGINNNNQQVVKEKSFRGSMTVDDKGHCTPQEFFIRDSKMDKDNEKLIIISQLKHNRHVTKVLMFVLLLTWVYIIYQNYYSNHRYTELFNRLHDFEKELNELKNNN